LPVVFYGTVLLFSALTYYILTRTLIGCHGQDFALAVTLGRDFKGKISVVIYAVAILLSFVNPEQACLLYVLVAIMWLIPDRRIERALAS
jgi:uncharacterized membrane protein